MYTYIYTTKAYNIIWSFSCHAQIRVVPYRLWGFLRSQILRWLMQNRGIGLGSSPIGNEGFCTPLSKAKAFPPLLRGGRVVGKNWNISKRVCVSPPTHRNISAKKAKNIWFMMVSPEPGWMHACIYIYLYVCIYVCMYVCLYVCMYVRTSKMKRFAIPSLG